MQGTIPILTELEAAASRLDRLGKTQAEIAESLQVSVRTVRRILTATRHKRAMIATVSRLALCGKSVDQIIYEIGGRVSDRTSRLEKVPA